jgi:uncharacterized membrane protein YsdA (DUF1294 family)
MKAALLYYLAGINVLAFLIFGWDKWAARRGAQRVPEARLLLCAALLGAPGAWLGVKVFRHKTVKTSFRVRLVLATLVNVAAVAAAAWWWWRQRESAG